MRKCSCSPTNLRSLCKLQTINIRHYRNKTYGNYSLSILSPSGDVLLSLLLLLLLLLTLLSSLSSLLIDFLWLCRFFLSTFPPVKCVDFSSINFELPFSVPFDDDIGGDCIAFDAKTDPLPVEITPFPAAEIAQTLWWPSQSLCWQNREQYLAKLQPLQVSRAWRPQFQQTDED